MSQPSRIDVARALLVKRDAAYRSNPALWAREQVRTQDESRKLVDLPWPDDEYLEDVFEGLQSKESKIAFPKSRRMKITWSVAAWVCHQARYQPGVAAYWQSRTQELAAWVLEQRIRYIEDHLAQRHLRRAYSANQTQMTYTDSGSRIYAVAMGANALRGPTPTVVVLDELDFMEEGQESLDAALPFAEHDAKIIGISTSNGPAGPLAKIAKEAGFVRYGGAQA